MTEKNPVSENVKLRLELAETRERLHTALSAIDGGNVPGWVLTDATEAAEGLLGLVDELLEEREKRMSDFFKRLGWKTDELQIEVMDMRNKFALKLGLDTKE